MKYISRTDQPILNKIVVMRNVFYILNLIFWSKSFFFLGKIDVYGISKFEIKIFQRNKLSLLLHFIIIIIIEYFEKWTFTPSIHVSTWSLKSFWRYSYFINRFLRKNIEIGEGKIRNNKKRIHIQLGHNTDFNEIYEM